jgi:hypothetical protein
VSLVIAVVVAISTTIVILLAMANEPWRASGS